MQFGVRMIICGKTQNQIGGYRVPGRESPTDDQVPSYRLYRLSQLYIP